MALFTKLFNRDHDPYSIPGARWYKIEVGLNSTIKSHDLPSEIIDVGFTQQYLEFKDTSKKHNVLRCEGIIHNLYDTGLTGGTLYPAATPSFLPSGEKWRLTTSNTSANIVKLEYTVYIYMT